MSEYCATCGRDLDGPGVRTTEVAGLAYCQSCGPAAIGLDSALAALRFARSETLDLRSHYSATSNNGAALVRIAGLIEEALEALGDDRNPRSSASICGSPSPRQEVRP